MGGKSGGGTFTVFIKYLRASSFHYILASKLKGAAITFHSNRHDIVTNKY